MMPHALDVYSRRSACAFDKTGGGGLLPRGAYYPTLLLQVRCDIFVMISTMYFSEAFKRYNKKLLLKRASEDLKMYTFYLFQPENLLYSKDGTLKLTDFGFAKFTNTDKPTLVTPCYTPYFAGKI